MRESLKIMIAGGGTGGSVMPLVAIIEELKKNTEQKIELKFIGSKKGIEKKIVQELEIPFESIQTGKLRRYFDLRNLIDPFKVFFGFLQSWFLITRIKPHIVLTAGSFVAVPVAWAAKVRKVPVVIHQQDIIVGLANKLMKPTAKLATVTYTESLESFKNVKTVLTGNPVRESILSATREEALKKLKLRNDLPVILVMGGGTGALHLNKIISEARPELTRNAQVLHITGKGKKIESSNQNYHSYEFLHSDMKYAYAAADVVVTRAGVSALSELALLKKACIIIPLPGTHQEANAKFFETKQAAKVLHQNELNAQKLIHEVKEYLLDTDLKHRHQKNIFNIAIPDASKRYVDQIFTSLHDYYA